MSQLNATVQQIQSPRTHAKELLPVFAKTKCYLQPRDEEAMYSLEILGQNHCEDISAEESKKIETETFIEEEKSPG